MSAIVLKPMIAFASSRGLDADAILRSIGLEASALDNFDQRIPDEDRRRVWASLSEQLQDPYLGVHFAPTVALGAYDALDYAMSASTTFGEAIDRILRFHQILCDSWAVEKEVDGEMIRLRRVASLSAPEAEAFAAVLMLRGRMIVGTDFDPCEVRFAHESTADPAPYRAFFRCHVQHGCAASEIVFRRSDLDRHASAANPGLNRVLDRYMSHLLERLPAVDPFVARVRASIARLMREGARPTLPFVAKAMHLSPRTLQRRLDEHGTSFFALVERVRRELGERLVTDRRLSLTEIAYLLGFSDLSGFRRAYKTWTGEIPSSVRVTRR